MAPTVEELTDPVVLLPVMVPPVMVVVEPLRWPMAAPLRPAVLLLMVPPETVSLPVLKTAPPS